ncbi:aldehyde dehydrogenase family protein [Gloeobacter kilaueensis]|uniref:Aldehyde dehydrogenase n=1 Tax=Gloeobacter kilaueensis (strain ATCC BAA-2537 / CCAP 1431/1 / ULC 316 / JS1) TaxID=1183438 RepID=U5QBT7_GLOK1|nr:aldehyde dehydrogenase family protein [Gloeobacter kilaueensis]AGY56283.1 aldehyde dehydrogenase [Gloeobacter kilaueensis JS1]
MKICENTPAGSLPVGEAAVRPDFAIDRTDLYIAGEWRPSHSGKTFAVIDPSSEAEIAEIAEGTTEDVEAAVQAAFQAFESGPWSELSGHERGEILWRVGDLFHRYGEELAFLQAKEMGRLFRDSMSVDIPHLANMFHYYAGWASKIEGAVKQTTKGLHTYTRREPLGVVAAITPFNFPLILSISKFAPALAAGNVIVHKPASATPLSALKVAQLMEEAGVPAGVFNVVPGPGGTVGHALSTHPLVEKVAITGSTASGIRVIQDSASTLKHLTMELGGKSANIIFADADLERAVQTAYDGMFYNKGEICYAGSRMLVERSVYEEVVERVRQRALATRPGDPLDPASDMGPIANRDEYTKVLRYLETGKSEGARLVAGGGACDIGTGRGFFVEPTVFADTTSEMTIVCEETFGPILSMMPFENFDEAIALANGNQYGLASGVHTRDIKKAHRAAAKLKAGTVWVNTYGHFDPSGPFGGYKMSGYGREQGWEALEFYLQTKTVWVDLEE